MNKLADWFWVVLAAIFAMWFAGGCVLEDLAVAECPAYDCSQCDVSLGDCLDAGFDLLDGDE